MSENQEGEKPSPKECPLCAFIEAGPCKQQHQEWVACREDAKERKEDYVTACSSPFRAFLQCTLEHADYYEPFHYMLGLGHVEDESQQQAEGTGDAAKQ